MPRLLDRFGALRRRYLTSFFLAATSWVGVCGAQAPSPAPRASDERVIVTALTVDQKIDDLFQRLFMSSRFDSNQQLIVARTQAEAGKAVSIIFYGDRKGKELPVWVLGVELGTYAKKGDVVFAYTCAKNGFGKTDIARATIREAVAGVNIQTRCGVASFSSGPSKYEYITAFWPKLVDEMYANDAVQREQFAALINYRPYARTARDKIEASDDQNNAADARTDIEGHGSSFMFTSSRRAWTY